MQLLKSWLLVSIFNRFGEYFAACSLGKEMCAALAKRMVEDGCFGASWKTFSGKHRIPKNDVLLL
jgi:hypothetical protein